MSLTFNIERACQDLRQFAGEDTSVANLGRDAQIALQLFPETWGFYVGSDFNKIGSTLHTGDSAINARTLRNRATLIAGKLEALFPQISTTITCGYLSERLFKNAPICLALQSLQVFLIIHLMKCPFY